MKRMLSCAISCASFFAYLDIASCALISPHSFCKRRCGPIRAPRVNKAGLKFRKIYKLSKTFALDSMM